MKTRTMERESRTRLKVEKKMKENGIRMLELS
jgi:hypothetical protein